MAEAPQRYRTTCTLEVKSLLLLPKYAGRQPTTKDRAKYILRSFSLPLSRFDLSISQPSVLELPEGRLEFSVRLKHLPQQSTAPLGPPVTVKSFTAQILSYTQSQTGRKYKDTSTECLASVRPLFQLGLFSPAENWTKFPVLGFPAGPPIPFGTAYRLEVNVAVVCADQVLEVKTVHPIAFKSETGGDCAPNGKHSSFVSRIAQNTALDLGAHLSDHHSRGPVGDGELPEASGKAGEKGDPPLYTETTVWV
ncbi:hypothetical protein H2199_003782 [Coniosporium tulheliwenetii]|uniref:Uncharacterized protein n=1 Tax=Coniosporium tulheliwenetii TaxID=3383036 RepID=A0ACC2Z827_9PEZI|nr:hypothetical protein H2199_003782 [Cladosporium sp. JES 115]